MSNLRQFQTQHFKRLTPRDFLEFFTFKKIQFSLNHCFKFPGQRDKNRPHRFVSRAAAWPGDSRDRDRKIRAEFFSRAFGHFARDRFAYRAVLFQSFGANTGKFLFCFVAVSHYAAQKDFRRARHIRDSICNKSARAGFRQSQRLFPFNQQAN